MKNLTNEGVGKEAERKEREEIVHQQASEVLIVMWGVDARVEDGRKAIIEKLVIGAFFVVLWACREEEWAKRGEKDGRRRVVP